MRGLVFGLVTAACVALVALRLEVRTAITDFLPRDERTGLLDLARELSQAPQARIVVLTLSANETAAHVEAARTLAERLRASGHFEWVRGGLSSDDESALYQLFFPARLGLSDLPADPGPVSDAWIEARIVAMKERLAGPLGALERRLAPDDPFGAFADLVARQAATRGPLRLEAGQLVTEDGSASVVFAASKQPAFDGAAQAAIARTVDEAMAALKKREPSLSLAWTGVGRYALEGERSVRGDIERISTLSVIGIFALYLLVFRSIREPLLVLFPIAFGCLFATALCQLCFGFVHGLALAFGSSIIGVAEDYSTHYFTHRLSAPASENNEQLMKRLWPGMLMGGVTTIAGIAMLFGSGFPGLQQMAVFGAGGVLGALLCTRYVLPSLSRKSPLPQRGRMATAGERWVTGWTQRPVQALYWLAPSLLVMAIGLPQLDFVDAVSALRTPTPVLEQENAVVQARLGRGEAGRVVVATGASDDEALARAEQVVARLERARGEGQIRSYRSLASLLPSTTTQRARKERLASDPTLVPRLHEALTRHGFVPSAFASFERALATPTEPLTSERVRASPLADLVSPFRAPLAGQIAYLTPIEAAPGVDVAALMAGLPGVHYLDQAGLYGEAYGRFRTRVLALVGLGLVLVLVTLWLRYRSVRVSALGMVPALLGAGAALGLEALRGVPMTLMHVIAVLLVLSMGVDYGIYALESRASAEEGATTLGSVVLASATTVLSFGLLGLSDNPALAAIGATVGFGMVFTVLASPVVLALSGGARS